MMGHGNFYGGSKPKQWNDKSNSEWIQYKNRIQDDFKNNNIQELVATKSFGMGIDKDNVRYTIHYGLPSSVEAYYQEAGRAGRNNEPQSAKCFIIYNDDNWDEAQEIIAEYDHAKAMKRLNAIKWGSRGNLIDQMWFLLNTYSDREQEKEDAFNLWKNKIWPEVQGMVDAATTLNEVEITFGRNRGQQEKALFRLVALGLVEDYSINWHSRRFLARVRHVKPDQIKDGLHRFLSNYKFKEYADEGTANVPLENAESAAWYAIGQMVDFVYDEIAAKRKQALNTMASLCRGFKSDQQFREAILAYLQESEFSETLKTWINKPFHQIGMESVTELLARVTTLDEAKRLVGTSRRMLDEDPSNIALRYISVCARLRNPAEDDSSVIQEARLLFQQLQHSQDLLDVEDIVFFVLRETVLYRQHLEEQLLEAALRAVGSAQLVKRYRDERHQWPASQKVHRAMLALLIADALKRIRPLIPGEID